MTIWFIADTHFGEQPKRRQMHSGMSAAELDDTIARRWRERVAESDVVWHLGDVGRDWRRVADLPGIKHLVLGNGDTAPQRMKKSELFASVVPFHRLAVADGSLYLIHIPEDALAQPSHEVVHGHHHHAEPLPGHRSVSVDRTSWGPITLDELLSRDR